MSISVLIEAALTLLRGTGARVLVLLKSPPEEVLSTLLPKGDFRVLLVGPSFEVRRRDLIQVSIPTNLDLESSLNLISAFLLEQGLLREGEPFVYVSEDSVGIKSVSKNIFAANGFFSHHQSVVQRLLEVAIELSVEGREGYPVGTLFVIGDVKNVLRHSHPMLPNPFKGHRISVLNRDSKEIIKEFAQIDGAFVVSSRGRIVAAGVYIEVDPRKLDLSLPKGLGSRHIAAAGITKLTKAIAISLSESGTIRIFKNGIMLLEYNPRMKY